MRAVVGVILLAIGAASVSLAQNNNKNRGNPYGNTGNSSNMGNTGNANGGGAAGRQAPEIDPGSAIGALILLSGGALVIRGRKRHLRA